MSNSLTAVEAVGREKPYRVPRAQTPIDLYLDGNEGVSPPPKLLGELAKLDTESLRRYPSTERVQRALASKLEVDESQVVVTAGADDAIDRVCRAVLEPGRNAVIPVPTFEMVPRFASMTGAKVRRVDGGHSQYPLQAVLDAVDEHTSLVVVISPNNPTGVTATDAQIERLAEECPHCLILVDHAYVEFAGRDFTRRAPEYDNVVVTRTLSKAWGLAGLRVGYAVGRARIMQWLKTAGSPYPVSKPSLLLATQWIETGAPVVQSFVDDVVARRQRLENLLSNLGMEPTPSRANFVFARVDDGLWWRDALAGQGIGVRAFPDRPGLEDAVRIACPGSASVMDRLERAIETVARPQALLFDLDGVFADVSRSYRRAVIETAESYGVHIDDAEVTAAKAAGDANNDWEVTRRLLQQHGVSAELDEVTERFEALYQGTDGEPGFWADEKLLIEPAYLQKLSDRGLKLAIVTGRPRRDAQRFVEHFGIGDDFETMVCMEDAARKPHPAPVRLAMDRLDVDRAWFVGDTPDDMRAGRAAGVLPLGIVAPEEDSRDMKDALLRAGAGRVLKNLDEILEVLK